MSAAKVGDLPRRNCWTCKHDSPRHHCDVISAYTECDARAWSRENVTPSGMRGVGGMPAKDADGCPDYEPVAPNPLPACIAAMEEYLELTILGVHVRCSNEACGVCANNREVIARYRAALAVAKGGA